MDGEEEEELGPRGFRDSLGNVIEVAVGGKCLIFLDLRVNCGDGKTRDT